jgi:hypothetical protein
MPDVCAVSFDFYLARMHASSRKIKILATYRRTHAEEAGGWPAEDKREYCSGAMDHGLVHESARKATRCSIDAHTWRRSAGRRARAAEASRAREPIDWFFLFRME